MLKLYLKVNTLLPLMASVEIKQFVNVSCHSIPPSFTSVQSLVVAILICCIAVSYSIAPMWSLLFSAIMLYVPITFWCRSFSFFCSFLCFFNFLLTLLFLFLLLLLYSKHLQLHMPPLLSPLPVVSMGFATAQLQLTVVWLLQPPLPLVVPTTNATTATFPRPPISFFCFPCFPSPSFTSLSF